MAEPSEFTGPKLSGPMIPSTDSAGRAADRPERIDLAELLTLEKVNDLDAECDHFSADSHWTPYGRLYGGQLMAQAVVAAGRTVAGLGVSRRVHSLQANFVDPGDGRRAVELRVRPLRRSRNYDLRQVEVAQGASLLMTATVSFADVGPGPDHQLLMPDVPGPESLPNLSDHLRHADTELGKYLSRILPIEQRHVEGPVSIPHKLPVAETQDCWLRALAELPERPPEHAAALAYMSDYIVMEAAMRRHQLHVSDEGLRLVTLAHNIWFHRPVYADEWHLFHAHSPSATGGLGLGMTHVFARDGKLVATVAQEGVVRFRSQVSRL